MLLDAAKSIHVNIYLVVVLGIYTGMRKSEISNARWEWFDFEKRIVTIQEYNSFNPKSRRSRTVPLHNTLARILSPLKKEKVYLFNDSERDRNVSYWYDFRRPFHQARLKCGLDWVTPHTLRHTFASLLASKGVSIYKIKEWLGHTDIRVTEIYSHLQAYDEDINRIE